MDLLLARLPEKLDAEHPIIIEEFSALNLARKNDAVSVMIAMLSELAQDGRECRFIKSLQGFPLSELKPKIRGGQQGGARVYFWIVDDEGAGVVNCEVKEHDAPASQAQIKQAFKVYLAHQQGIAVVGSHSEDTTADDRSKR